MNNKLTNTIFNPPKCLKNNRGSAIIASFFVMTIMLGLAASFSINSISEMNEANRLYNSTAALWAAEGVAARFVNAGYYSTVTGAESCTPDIDNDGLVEDCNFLFGPGTVKLVPNGSDPTVLVMKFTGTVGNVSRNIRLEFKGSPPYALSKTMSSGGNITVSDDFNSLEVKQESVIAGNLIMSGSNPNIIFDTLNQNQASAYTTLKYPDADNNGTSDEFDDFRQFNQDLLSTYNQDDVLYIQDTGVVEIKPSEQLIGKKVIYVEGNNEDDVVVNIIFGLTWEDNQNVTIITTGSINYAQPLLQNSTNGSQLNTISWGNYNEGSVFESTHYGVTFTHNEANFNAIDALSFNSGCLIANSNINFIQSDGKRILDWEDPIDANGDVPPGFKGLISAGSVSYATTPNKWYEY